MPYEVVAFLHFGWTVAILLTGFCLLGIYLDKKFQFSPVGILSFGVLGIIFSGYLFFSTIKKISDREQKDG